MKICFFARLLALLVLSGRLSVLSYAEGYIIGDTAPAFELTSLDGKLVSLADYRGKIVVMGFMTSWCPFCNAAAPYFYQIGKQYQDKGVETLIVDLREEKGPISEFVKKYNLSCPVVLDTDGKIAERYAPPPRISKGYTLCNTVMLGSFFIIDKRGEIQFLSSNDGATFDAKLTKLQAHLDKLLSEK